MTKISTTVELTMTLVTGTRAGLGGDRRGAA